MRPRIKNSRRRSWNRNWMGRPRNRNSRRKSRSRNRKLTPRNGNTVGGDKGAGTKEQDTREVDIDDDIGKYFATKIMSGQRVTAYYTLHIQYTVLSKLAFVV